MTSVPKRFAGFQTAASVLRDYTLSREQKQTALLSWRAALQKAAPAEDESISKVHQMIADIDDALLELGHHPAAKR